MKFINQILYRFHINKNAFVITSYNLKRDKDESTDKYFLPVASTFAGTFRPKSVECNSSVY